MLKVKYTFEQLCRNRHREQITFYSLCLSLRPKSKIYVNEHVAAMFQRQPRARMSDLGASFHSHLAETGDPANSLIGHVCADLTSPGRVAQRQR